MKDWVGLFYSYRDNEQAIIRGSVDGTGEEIYLDMTQPLPDMHQAMEMIAQAVELRRLATLDGRICSHCLCRMADQAMGQVCWYCLTGMPRPPQFEGVTYAV